MACQYMPLATCGPVNMGENKTRYNYAAQQDANTCIYAYIWQEIQKENVQTWMPQVLNVALYKSFKIIDSDTRTWK